jgi:hypothetical protein
MSAEIVRAVRRELLRCAQEMRAPGCVVDNEIRLRLTLCAAVLSCLALQDEAMAGRIVEAMARDHPDVVVTIREIDEEAR